MVAIESRRIEKNIFSHRMYTFKEGTEAFYCVGPVRNE